VGGDFYDVFEAETGQTAIVLGDVSGKGVPAALLVSMLHGAIRSSTGCWGVFPPAGAVLQYRNSEEISVGAVA
jgi:hypothetical protein